MAKFNLLGYLKKQLSFKKPLESLLFLGLVLFILYLINKHVLPMLNLNIENFENDNSKKLVYFYMDGCGHCNNFTPIWDEFCNSNTSSITTHKIERSNAPDKLEKYNINGYPTVLLLSENNDKIKEFNEERTVKGLQSFVNVNKNFNNKN